MRAVIKDKGEFASQMRLESGAFEVKRFRKLNSPLAVSEGKLLVGAWLVAEIHSLYSLVHLLQPASEWKEASKIH